MFSFGDGLLDGWLVGWLAGWLAGLDWMAHYRLCQCQQAERQYSVGSCLVAAFQLRERKKMHHRGSEPINQVDGEQPKGRC